MTARLGCRRIEFAGRRDARVVRRVLGWSRVGTAAGMYTQRGRGVMMMLGGGVRRHTETERETSIGSGRCRIVVLTGGSGLMVVASVEATRSLLKVRVHYPEYFESLALKHRHSRTTKSVPNERKKPSCAPFYHHLRDGYRDNCSSIVPRKNADRAQG